MTALRSICSTGLSTMRMLQAMRASKVVPLIRVPWLDAGPIMKALDAGAYGVICPMINNRQQAERLVSYVRYPPGRDGDGDTENSSCGACRGHPLCAALRYSGVCGQGRGLGFRYGHYFERRAAAFGCCIRKRESYARTDWRNRLGFAPVRCLLRCRASAYSGIGNHECAAVKGFKLEVSLQWLCFRIAGIG